MSDGQQIFETATQLVNVTYKTDKPIVVHQGGTSSSKTYSILQTLALFALNDPNSLITVVGQDIPNLKKGAYREAKDIYFNNDYISKRIKWHNRSDREIHFKNGSVIEFSSFEDSQDAKSGKRDYLFVNEANGVDYPIFEELSVRTNKISIIDFNPTAEFWAHTKLKGRPDVRWVTSTFKHNPFINQSISDKIKSYEPTEENIARGTANKYRWQVYGLGQIGRLEGLVFEDWKEASDYPADYQWRIWGMDFGFSNDPSTLIEIRYSGGGLYWKEHIFETGLTNKDISRKLKEIQFDQVQAQGEYIVADSAEPKSIRELKNDGWYVVPAQKGADSVNAGIQLLKNYPIYVYWKSRNLIEEFSTYTWKLDKNGEPTNKPVDYSNHGIDAGRYAAQDKLTKKVIEFQAI